MYIYIYISIYIYIYIYIIRHVVGVHISGDDFPPLFSSCIQVRGSFGSWQGKKFALVHQSEMVDAPPPFALTGAPGTRTRLERPKSAGFHGANTNGQWLLIESICIHVRMYACVYMCVCVYVHM